MVLDRSGSMAMPLPASGGSLNALIPVMLFRLQLGKKFNLQPTQVWCNSKNQSAPHQAVGQILTGKNNRG